MACVLTVINRDERIIYCNNVNIWLVGSRTHNKTNGWLQGISDVSCCNEKMFIRYAHFFIAMPNRRDAPTSSNPIE